MQIARPVAQDGNDPAGIKAGIAEERGEHGVKAEKEYELEVKSYLLMAEENEEVAFFNEPQSMICNLRSAIFSAIFALLGRAV
jgi:hypothetical protein